MVCALHFRRANLAAQEKQRVLGVFPQLLRQLQFRSGADDSETQKFKLALRVAVDPVTIAGIGFIARLDQAGNTPDYQQGAKSHGEVWRYRISLSINSRMDTAVREALVGSTRNGHVGADTSSEH